MGFCKEPPAVDAMFGTLRKAPEAVMERNHDDQQTCFFGDPGCRCGCLSNLPPPIGRKPAFDKGAQRRAGARALRRRLLLERSHPAIADGRSQRDLRAKSV